ncbi:hypothetical protein DSECCO2_418620 [anaerobic digester metagenome]
MNKTLCFYMLIVSLLSACNQKEKLQNKTETIKETSNEAVLVLHQNEKGAEAFPLNDTVRIPVKTVETSSGSYSSVSFDFEVNDGGRVNTIHVLLPAAPGLPLKEDNQGGMTLFDIRYPYTLKGSDYKPYKNALYETEMKPYVWLQSIVKSPDGASSLYFDIEEMTIREFDFTNEKSNAEISFKLKQQAVSETRYGKYSAELKFRIHDFSRSRMMVD